MGLLFAITHSAAISSPIGITIRRLGDMVLRRLQVTSYYLIRRSFGRFGTACRRGRFGDGCHIFLHIVCTAPGEQKEYSQ
jgi:hypothetical protein